MHAINTNKFVITMDEIHIPLDQFENICRTCLTPNQLKPIFNDNNSNLIAPMLMAVANINVEIKDGLPTKMCCSCIRELDEAFRFKRKCEVLDLKLREILNEHHSERDQNEIKCENELADNSEYDLLHDETYLNSDETETKPEIIEMNTTKLNNYNNEDDFQANNINNIKSENGVQLVKCEKNSLKQKRRENMKPCDICNKKIRSTYFKIHLRTHLSQKPFTCEKCNRSFRFRNNYVRHMKIHTDERPYKCEFCNQRFRQRYTLKEHIRVHTQERPYKCKFCDKTFRQASSRLIHQRQHPTGGADEQNNEHECSICKKRFATTVALNGHSRTHKFKMYDCDECGKHFNSQSSLENHIATDERHVEVSKQQTAETPSDQIYDCNECGKHFVSQSHLKNHHKRHEDGSLIDPKQHSRKVYLCNYCGKEFTTKPCFDNHLRVHTQERPYSCSFCSKMFKTQNALRVHKFTHTNERPYACDQCDRTFHQGAHLVAHKRVHTGEKPYQCVVCVKRFAIKHNLTVHERIHSGETPFVCTICEKGFYDSSSLKKHYKSHN